MAENAPTPETDNNPNEIRSTLIKRLAVAGVLVASLLGMLAFFDYLATAPEEPEAPVFTRPVPVVPKKEVSQPVTPATDLPEPPTSSTPEPVIEAPPAPVVEAQPPAIIDVKPEIRPDIRPDIRPPTASTAGATKAPVAASPTPARQPHVVPEDTGAPSVDVAPAPAKPTARVLETRPAQAVSVPTPQRLFAGFLLQAGVFSSAQRAEELHAKLLLSGVPSSLEARVQVGPFRTRQEAEAAQARLKQLGIESVLLPPKGAK